VILKIVTVLIAGNQVYGSCSAPRKTECETIRVEKPLGRFKPWPSLFIIAEKKACHFRGNRLFEKEGSVIEEPNEFFLRDRSIFDRYAKDIFKNCPSEGELLKGDLIWYFGCGDGGIGLEKDPSFPEIIVREDCRE
jgi:hypothetical protein